MIYFTGDTHGDITRLHNSKLRKNDSLIVCGDFGFIWDGTKKEKSTLKHIGKLKYHVLFVEGVHENFDLLDEYKEVDYMGAKARQISGNLYQLMRGNVYTIEDKKILAFGSGQSEENTSYLDCDDDLEIWQREVPTKQEIDSMWKMLALCNNTVDYVVSYEPPCEMASFLDYKAMNYNHINTLLQNIREKIAFERWFFGKLHLNKFIPQKFFATYDEILNANEENLTCVGNYIKQKR